jgi:hemerythrin-like metal-binding protein
LNDAPANAVSGAGAAAEQTTRSPFAVGVPSIDALHVECEAMLLRLSNAIETGTGIDTALAALQEHLGRHFSHEEALMAQTSFPPAGCHEREHAMVLEVVAEVCRRHGAGDRAPAERLAAAVTEWFELHAAGMDAALAAWLNARRDEAVSADATLGSPAGRSVAVQDRC